MARSISTWMKSVERRLSNHDRRLHRRPSAALMSPPVLRSEVPVASEEPPPASDLTFGMEPEYAFTLGTGGALVQTAGGSVWADFGTVDMDVSGEILPRDEEPLAGVIFRVRDVGHRLGLLLNVGTSEVEWIKVEGGEVSRLGTDPLDLTEGPAYAVRVTAEGPDLRAYVDDELVSEFTLEGPDEGTFTGTGAGWVCDSPTPGLTYRGLRVSAIA